MNRKKWICLILLVIFFSLTSYLFYGWVLRADAKENPSMAFVEFNRKHQIEDSVLLIGTHLLHLNSVTDELYELALESASQSSQYQIYYKSELAEGAWFDITDATGLSDISLEGRLVSLEEMKDLKIEFYTFSDGITKRALTDEQINLFEINAPYDLYELEELEALRQQFDQQFSEEDTGVKQYYYEKLRDFFLTDLRNSVTAECDRQLRELQTLYENLQTREEREQAEIVLTLMKKIDAKRRAEILYQLSQQENHLLNRLQEICTGSEYDKEKYLILIEVTEEETEEETEESEEGTAEGTEEETEETEEVKYEEEKEQFVENSGVLDAISTALQNCQTSYIEYTANRLEAGTTLLSNLEYEKSVYVIEQAASNPEIVLGELGHLYHIRENMIVDQEGELLLIETQLLPRVEEKYKKALTEGVGETYKVALANGGGQIAINQALTQQKTALNAILQEVKFAVQTQAKRKPAEEALNEIYAGMDETSAWETGIIQDAFAGKAEESLAEYRLWMQELAKSILTANQEFSSQMDLLEENKAEMLLDYQQALDDNDLALAKRYQALLQALEEEIQSKQQELQAILDNPNSSLADQAKAANQTGSTSLLNQIEELKRKGLADLAEGKSSAAGGTALAGERNSLGSTISTLSALGAEGALSQLKEEAEKKGDEKLQKELDEAIEKSRESALHGVLDEGAGQAVQVEQDYVERAIEEFFGGSLDELTSKQQAEVLLAVDRLLEEGNSSLKGLFDTYYQLLSGEGRKAGQTGSQNGENSNQADSKGTSDYLFTRFTGSDQEYVALLPIARLGRYRYIYDDTKKVVTLSKGVSVYQIKAGSNKMSIYPDRQEELTSPARYGQDVYLQEEDAKKWFSWEAEYLEGKNTAICLDQGMGTRAEKLYQLIQERKGGE